MKTEKQNRKYNLQSLTAEIMRTAEQLDTDPEAFELAGLEECEEQHFTLDGRPILDDSSSK